MTDEELQEALGHGARRDNPRSAEDLLALVRDRDREAAMLRRVAAGMSVVTAMLLVGLWLLPRVTPAPLAMKGAGQLGQAKLVWAVEGPGSSPSTVSDVADGAWVVFGVEGTASGFACLDEASPEGWTRVLPPAGRVWPVAPGRSFFEMDGTPQAFRTELGSGERAYRLRVHPDDASCHGAVDAGQWELRWLD